MRKLFGLSLFVAACSSQTPPLPEVEQGPREDDSVIVLRCRDLDRIYLKDVAPGELDCLESALRRVFATARNTNPMRILPSQREGVYFVKVDGLSQREILAGVRIGIKSIRFDYQNQTSEYCPE